MDDFQLRSMQRDEWPDVARLIFDSTNQWYIKHGHMPVFQCRPEQVELFCQVYEALDPGCCVVAIEQSSGKLAGSCFYHPRSTHVSLGIMNAHPDFFGRGVAARLLRFITDLADRRNQPVRLVSSAMNLDSYSLYNRAGFAPKIFHHTMFMRVPEDGLYPVSDGVERVRPAVPADVPAMVALEREINHIEREKDYRYFLENALGCWHVAVLEGEDGRLDGFLAAIDHPASTMLGPGIMRGSDAALALILYQLDRMRGRSPAWLIPAAQRKLIETLYVLGARNCELHLAQVRGDWQLPEGIVMPTFMPETG